MPPTVNNDPKRLWCLFETIGGRQIHSYISTGACHRT
jgi:hypothetical protein